jgi:hypothetical protein
MARADGRALGLARGLPGEGLHPGEDGGVVRPPVARARHADRDARAPAHGGDAAGLPCGRGGARARRGGAGGGDPAAPADLLDEPETIAGAARDLRLDPDEVREWMEDPAVEDALDADMAAAREPIPAARVLDHKLAEWEDGLRYTCPSYEVVRLSDGVKIAIPGFQPFAAYDVVLANLVPGTDRREPPSSVEEVLAWAGEPLTTKEVAVVCDISMEDAREALGRVAIEEHLGFDGLWTLPGVDYRSASSAERSASASGATASAAVSSSGA